jgi:hypothetical protein
MKLSWMLISMASAAIFLGTARIREQWQEWDNRDQDEAMARY